LKPLTVSALRARAVPAIQVSLHQCLVFPGVWPNGHSVVVVVRTFCDTKSVKRIDK